VGYHHTSTIGLRIRG